MSKTNIGFLLLLGIIILLMLGACGRTPVEALEPPTDPTTIEIATTIPLPTPPPIITTPPPTTPPPPESPPPGFLINPITGLYIAEDAAARRPFAVVFGNESRSLPQSGLPQACIIYEVLAEGATTRIIAIFSDFDAPAIGPVRSSRQYFNNFAHDHGAILVRHGGSHLAYAAIAAQGLSDINGMRYEGSVFWRDNERRRTRGLEHSSFTSAQNLINTAQTRGITAPIDTPAMFAFFDTPTNPAPNNPANAVTIPFAGTNAPHFRFDEASGLYYKYIFGSRHMDEASGEQLAVTNIIVQITNIRHIAGDAEGRRAVDLVGSGAGYLFTGGGYMPITWEKTSTTSPTRWFDSNGNILTINRGQTWVNVINTSPVIINVDRGG